ncbi:MAG TPA: DUF58 domain-containing protein [Iamia sp.]|nr:DUF58 domain-containing protein [Iamia sp.]
MTTGPASDPPVRARPDDPDRTARRLRARPPLAGVVALAVLAALLGVATRHGTLGMLVVALGGLAVYDALSARAALKRVEVTVANPIDGVAGEPSVHVVQARGIVAPIELVLPVWWDAAVRSSIALRGTGPGTMVIDAPDRGVVTHMVFDLVAPGPLGLTEAARRIRVWLPAPWHVGPAGRAHDPGWPRLRTIPPGESSTVTQGDDLFRGVRPYTRGDPRRSVHWPATAHRGTLMVKERDGIEQVALRVVLELDDGGPDAEAAVERAAWLVEHGLSRGWRVHLVTAEAPPAPAAPLLRPGFPLPPPPPVGPATHTVARAIERVDGARHQLAAVGIGLPAQEPWKGLTRVVTPAGDRWQ